MQRRGCLLAQRSSRGEREQGGVPTRMVESQHEGGSWQSVCIRGAPVLGVQSCVV
jgi:hypothetical protein